jgi:hypothetical protein
MSEYSRSESASLPKLRDILRIQLFGEDFEHRLAVIGRQAARQLSWCDSHSLALRCQRIRHLSKLRDWRKAVSRL